MFPQIRRDDDTWYFNSSIAEQTTVWMGGYHPIIWEMTSLKYNFFLDEMIKETNIMTLERLEVKGCVPLYRVL